MLYFKPITEMLHATLPLRQLAIDSDHQLNPTEQVNKAGYGH